MRCATTEHWSFDRERERERVTEREKVTKI